MPQSSEQQQQLNSQECVICFTSAPDSIFQPCGHGGYCYDCAKTLLTSSSLCPICRQVIEEIYKIDIHHCEQNRFNVICKTKVIVKNQMN